MGRYYAEIAGHDDGVPQACEEHYRPLGPSDAVPTHPVSIAVALADKLDMLTGFWAIDEKPTGSKDPFALRRAALGVIRIDLGERSSAFAVRCRLIITLRAMIDAASRVAARRETASRRGVPEQDGWSCRVWSKPASDHGRREMGMGDQARSTKSRRPPLLLRRPPEGLPPRPGHPARRHPGLLRARQHGQPQDDLVLLVNRVRALQDFLATDDGENLLIAYRRAANIVAKAEDEAGPNVVFEGEVQPRLFELPEEHALVAALDAAEPAIAAALHSEDFAAAMTGMARLRAPIDAFFDKVTVNAENPVVRRNRLCLLTRVRQVMRRVAIWDAIEG